MQLNDMQVSFALYRRVMALSEYGRRYQIQRGHDGDCANCEDAYGFLYLYLLETESDEYEPGMLPIASTGKYGRFQVTGWPCPTCNTEKVDQTQENLAKNSGLSGLEFDWKVEYFKGMNGKSQLLTLGNNLVKQAPLPKGFCTVFGDYGMGKSGMAKAVVAEMVKVGGNAMYRRAADILLEARHTFTDVKSEDLPEVILAKSEAGAIHKYQSVQLLVVDEVDRTSKKEWSASTIFTILDHRYNQRDKLCTIIITNVHPDKLDSSYGYLASRMKDGYRCAVTGKELRGNYDSIPI